MAKKIRLEDLFRWKTKVDIKNRKGDIITSVYVRLASDSDFQEAQTLALAESRKARAELRDKSTIRHQSLFADIDSRGRDDMILSILSAEGMDIRDEAQSELGPIEYPKLPDNASLEDREKHDEEISNLEKEYTDKLSKLIEKKMHERREEIEKFEPEKLKEVYMSSMIAQQCVEIFNQTFRSYCVYLNTFSDEKLTQREFSSWDAFKKSSTFVKTQLLEAYLNLEISGDDLKN